LVQYDYMFREAGLASYISRLYSSLSPKYPSYTIFHYACEHLSTQATHGPIRGDVISPSFLGIAVGISESDHVCKIKDEGKHDDGDK